MIGLLFKFIYYMGENSSIPEHILQRIKINNIHNSNANQQLHGEGESEAAALPAFTEQYHPSQEKLPILSTSTASAKPSYPTANQLKKEFKSKFDKHSISKFKINSLYHKIISKNTIEAFLCFLGTLILFFF